MAPALTSVRAQPEREPLTKPTIGFYSAPVGSRFTFALDVRQSAGVRAANGGPPQAMTTQLRGSLVTWVVDRRDDQLVVESRLVDPTFDRAAGNAGDGDALARDLAKPTRVRMHADGDVLGFAFADDLDIKSENWVRSILTAVRFAIEPQQAEWTRDEADATGIARTTYTWERSPEDHAPGLLRKDKCEYVGDTAPKPSVEAVGRATIDPTLGWLTEVEFREQLRVDQPEYGFIVEASFDLRAKLTEHAMDSSLPSAAKTTAWQTVDGRDAARRAAEVDRAAELAAQAKQASLPELLLELEAGLAEAANGSPRHAAALHLLAAFLKLRPEALGDLDAKLRAGALRAEVVDSALVAIAMAGTDAAQTVIANLATSASVLADTRLAAVRSVFAMREPNRRLVEQLASVTSDPSNAELRNTSLLALGCATSRVGEEHRDLAAATLARMRPSSPAGLSLWFQALGNAGAPESLGWTAADRASADPGIRADSLTALRRIPGAAAFDVLRTIARDDRSADVRTAALRVLCERQDPGVVPTLLAASTRQSTPSTLRIILGGLAQHRRDPAVRPRLVQIAQTHSDPQVRGMAQQILARD